MGHKKLGAKLASSSAVEFQKVVDNPPTLQYYLD